MSGYFNAIISVLSKSAPNINPDLVYVTQDKQTLDITLPFLIEDKHKLRNALQECFLVHGCTVPKVINIHTKVYSHKLDNAVQGHKQIKNILAVVSGKGGVGKSTVAINTAIALHALGARVGILDADIHGPSQPTMLGVDQAVLAQKGRSLNPIERHGITSASISYFMTKDDPVIWRGPMVSRALEQMVHDVCWDALDYLLIDMPPGTGDIALTLTRKIPVAGGIIVTTPQDVARIDAEKSAKMLQQMHVPILGVVENMSIHRCSVCGHEEAIFGEGGGQWLSDAFSVALLGRLPLDKATQRAGDKGMPIVLEDISLMQRYKHIAQRMSQTLAQRLVDVIRE